MSTYRFVWDEHGSVSVIWERLDTVTNCGLGSGLWRWEPLSDFLNTVPRRVGLMPDSQDTASATVPDPQLFEWHWPFEGSPYTIREFITTPHDLPHLPWDSLELHRSCQWHDPLEHCLPSSKGPRSMGWLPHRLWNHCPLRTRRHGWVPGVVGVLIPPIHAIILSVHKQHTTDPWKTIWLSFKYIMMLVTSLKNVCTSLQRTEKKRFKSGSQSKHQTNGWPQSHEPPNDCHSQV